MKLARIVFNVAGIYGLIALSRNIFSKAGSGRARRLLSRILNIFMDSRAWASPGRSCF